jgi:hypothetical protein
VDEADQICQDEPKEVLDRRGMEEQRVQTERVHSEREKPGMVVVRGKLPSCQW